MSEVEQAKTEVLLTMQLQVELEKMSEEEFKEYMKDKVLVYNGKRYGYQKPGKKRKVQ